MDYSTFTCITPEVRRLASFQRKPLPNHQKLRISNSPAKLAKAGFMRSTDAIKDEVCCESCGIVYGDWAGESPFAVHRVLNENCPILINTVALADDVLQHPSVVSVRRRWTELFSLDEHDATDDRSEGESESDADNSHNSINEQSVGWEDEFVDNRLTPELGYNRLSGVADHNRVTDSSGPVTPAVPSQSEPDNNASQQQPYVSVMSPQSSFTFPFEPRVGGFSMLFASRRQKTFSDSGCSECIEWAEEGFVFRSATNDVQCVFCELTLPFDTCDPKQAHEQKSVYCPRVLLFDVGNISTSEEERIRIKNLQRQLRTKSSPDRHYAISYPQYEEESVRLGTYDNWTLGSWDNHLQPSLMSQAGFYFTGLADKVQCYCCGVALRQWRQGSDPWEQHARHMPTCPHLVAKGDHFIEQQAAQAQVLTVADLSSTSASSSYDSGGSGSPGELWTSPPGALTLDAGAIIAAVKTSRFPTKDILLGTLRAAEENFTTVCHQRDTIYQKDAALQQKDTALQQKDTALQQKDTVIQEKDTVIQQKDTVIQQTYTELEQHMGIVEQQNQRLQQQNQLLQQHQLELQAKEQELERRRRLMSYQEAQIESLRIQMQSLLEDRRQAGRQAAPLQAPAAAAAPPAEAANDDAGEGPTMYDIRCKVCLASEIKTIFQPCNHVSCCDHCAKRLLNDVCPVCRAPIRNVLPAHIS